MYSLPSATAHGGQLGRYGFSVTSESEVMVSFALNSMIAPELCPNLDFWMRVKNDTTYPSYTSYLDTLFKLIDADKAPHPWLIKAIMLYLFAGMFSSRV